MQDTVTKYLIAKKNLFSDFGCGEEYFIKPLVNYNWAIEKNNDMYFLAYWDQKDNRTSSIIVKKNGEPMVYKSKDFTMVIGIDCVKIAFIFTNTKNI